ncbi:MAG: bifunctional riboflavin kinase/FAD synthetase [Nitrospirota bacterium]|nr:bifunctional riboflavin kinase/FAD synthetase [Nitrospirota bacterium]
MRIVRGIAQIPQNIPRPVVTLGNFDGVHLGHRSIFQKIRKRARDLGGTSVVFTFEPHPLKVITPEKSPLLLNTPARREQLIEDTGIDMLVLAEFTQSFAEMEPALFVEKILWEKIGPAEIHVGPDYAFGKGRKGTISLLEELGGKLGFTVTVEEPFLLDGQVVSSTRVRDCLARGDMAGAARLLGRHYSIEGEVIGGAGRGHSLGFPTANIRTPNELTPRDGVYAVFVEVEGRWYEGAANLGTNPTFGEGGMNYEVHIFDFHDAIYQKQVRIHFVERIREERKFDTVDQLVQQIRADVEIARLLLAQNPVMAASHKSD